MGVRTTCSDWELNRRHSSTCCVRKHGDISSADCMVWLEDGTRPEWPKRVVFSQPKQYWEVTWTWLHKSSSLLLQADIVKKWRMFIVRHRFVVICFFYQMHLQLQISGWPLLLGNRYRNTNQLVVPTKRRRVSCPSVCITHALNQSFTYEPLTSCRFFLCKCICDHTTCWLFF